MGNRYVYEFDPSDRPLVLQLGGCSAKPIIELANMDMCASLIGARYATYSRYILVFAAAWIWSTSTVAVRRTSHSIKVSIATSLSHTHHSHAL